MTTNNEPLKSSFIQRSDDCEGQDCVVIQYEVISITLEAEIDPISGTTRPIASFGERLRSIYKTAFETGVNNSFREKPSPDGPQCEESCTCEASADPADVLTNWTTPRTREFKQPFTRSTSLKVILAGKVQRRMRKVKGLCGMDRTGDELQGVPENVDFGYPIADAELVTVEPSEKVSYD